MQRQHDGAVRHIGNHPPNRLISVDTVMPATAGVAVFSSAFVATALLASMMLPFGIIVLVTGNLSQPGPDIVVLGVAGIFAVAAVLTFKRLNYWNQVDLKRQAAAHGDPARVNLAAIQPAIETVALTEPLMVGARLRRPAVFAMRATLALHMVLVAMVWLAAIVGYLSHSPAWMLPVAILTTAIMLFRVLARPASILHDLSEGQWISADEQGITFRLIGEPRHIPWQDAQLFAIYRGDPRRPPRWYDVSSAQTVLHWVWLRPGTLLALLFEPMVPFDENDRRMETLLAVIATRTGLPLYDLR